MNSRASRRRWVPLITIGTIAVPATLGLLFPSVALFEEDGRIPDAVTRPRIDPNPGNNPGYEKSPAPKY